MNFSPVCTIIKRGIIHMYKTTTQNSHICLWHWAWSSAQFCRYQTRANADVLFII